MSGKGGTDEKEMEVEDEEFRVWKKNTPVLYDLVISHPLEWPSLTVHWSPLSPHTLLLGTHTSNGSPNFLILADVSFPPTHPPKVEIKHMLPADGEVNRARFMPQNPSVIGAKTNGCDVYVFDSSKPSTSDFDPHLRLRGHRDEGYGLSWSLLREGYLLSASHDRCICLWDILAIPQDTSVLDAMHVFEGHSSAIGDVSWHPKNDSLFGSVGDDCLLMIWDSRTYKPEQRIKAHEKEVNGLSFNLYTEWIVATASSDATIGLFDLRKLTLPLHVLSGHDGEVLQVDWDPNHEAVLASSSDDRRVIVWDINRIGDEQQEGDASDGPAELLFSHGGHKARISDFAWNKSEPWIISSVAEDNSLQVWEMAESIYHDDD
ncbi:hypothetical protein MLD38_027045 [Melastoma candidum]|uniref:Uncharacterized protein n=1 Tax=Melastoma candidum TaxID=119954 RepID=A0ACB9P0Y9_9MYRT|nr:hypothetical protein MLD38_027045 [Melastoma candidum]